VCVVGAGRATCVGETGEWATQSVHKAGPALREPKRGIVIVFHVAVLTHDDVVIKRVEDAPVSG
jgi:hypothetical protein